MRAFSIFVASALALGIAAAANSADAGCKRFGFTVNDYGKEGPTNDAKALLDKHVTKWAAENSISDYRVGKKDVKCELFLDFVVFDEYTCTASANVCWGADLSKIAPSASDGDVAMENEKPPAPVSKVAAGLKREKPAAAPTETAEAAAETASEEAATAEAAPEAPAAETQAAASEAASPPADEPPAATASVTPASSPADTKPDVSVSTGAPVVETGALGQNAMPDAKSMTPPNGDHMAATEDDDQAAAASSAAAAAAAAAERAAAAAETAAAAAKEAAAAAVAASAANRGVIVPPLDGNP